MISNTVDYHRTCPHCGYQMNSATDLDGDASPEDGDAAICISCGGIAIFTDDRGQLQFRMPTDAETAEVMEDPRVAEVINRIRSNR